MRSGGDVLTFTRDTMAGPPQVYVMKPGQAPVQITHVGETALKGVEMSPYEPFTFTGWNKETVHGWIVKPYRLQAGPEVPHCHADPRRPAGLVGGQLVATAGTRRSGPAGATAW